MPTTGANEYKSERNSLCVRAHEKRKTGDANRRGNDVDGWSPRGNGGGEKRSVPADSALSFASVCGGLGIESTCFFFLRVKRPALV